MPKVDTQNKGILGTFRHGSFIPHEVPPGYGYKVADLIERGIVLLVVLYGKEAKANTVVGKGAVDHFLLLSKRVALLAVQRDQHGLLFKPWRLSIRLEVSLKESICMRAWIPGLSEDSLEVISVRLDDRIEGPPCGDGHLEGFRHVEHPKLTDRIQGRRSPL